MICASLKGWQEDVLGMLYGLASYSLTNCVVDMLRCPSHPGTFLASNQPY